MNTSYKVERLLGFRKQIRETHSFTHADINTYVTCNLETISKLSSAENDFTVPYNVEVVELLWVHTLQNLPRYVFVRLSNNMYGLYNSDIKTLFISESRPVIVQFGMSRTIYTLYYNETEYFKSITGFQGLKSSQFRTIDSMESMESMELMETNLTTAY